MLLITTYFRFFPSILNGPLVWQIKTACIITNYKNKWNTVAIFSYQLHYSACAYINFLILIIFILKWLMQRHARLLVWTGRMLSKCTWWPIDLERWTGTYLEILLKMMLNLWKRDKQLLCILNSQISSFADIPIWDLVHAMFSFFVFILLNCNLLDIAFI